MAVSLETRVPYLDPEMVELAFSIPEKWKVSGGRTKILLKNVAERHIPRDCIYRPKEGFSIPIKNWLCRGAAPVDGGGPRSEDDRRGRPVSCRDRQPSHEGTPHGRQPQSPPLVPDRLPILEKTLDEGIGDVEDPGHRSDGIHRESPMPAIGGREQVVAFVRPTSDVHELEELSVKCLRVDHQERHGMSWTTSPDSRRSSTSPRPTGRNTPTMTSSGWSTSRRRGTCWKVGKAERSSPIHPLLHGGSARRDRPPPGRRGSIDSCRAIITVVKMEGESLARRYFSEGLPGVVVRPVGIYGPGETTAIPEAVQADQQRDIRHDRNGEHAVSA